MQLYAETRGCRREYLLRYFGDDFAGPCGNCDRCEAAAAIGQSRSPAAQTALGNSHPGGLEEDVDSHYKRRLSAD
jgi:superfamily II DNA helicase RecQ